MSRGEEPLLVLDLVRVQRLKQKDKIFVPEKKRRSSVACRSMMEERSPGDRSSHTEGVCEGQTFHHVTFERTDSAVPRRSCEESNRELK